MATKKDTNIEIESKAAKKVARKVKHDPSELVMCKSTCYGGLHLIGPKTDMVYSWSNFGDVREVEYQDLLSWKVLHSQALFEPFIMIMDDDLREEWDRELGDMYRKIEKVDIEDLFEMPASQFKENLKKFPESVKESVKDIAYSKMKDQTLYDIRIIKAIDEILGTELLMMLD